MPSKRRAPKSFPHDYPEPYTNQDDNASDSEYSPTKKTKKQKNANQPSKSELAKISPMISRDDTDCPPSRGPSPDIDDGLIGSGPNPTLLTSDLNLPASTIDKATPITGLVTHAADQQVKVKIDLASILGSKGSIIGLNLGDGKISIDLSAFSSILSANNGLKTALTITGVEAVDEEHDTEMTVDEYNALTATEKHRHATRKIEARKKATAAQEAEEAQRKKNEPLDFLKFPYEVREKVYKLVLVAKAPVDFHFRENFKNNGQLLRACKQIYREGREVLYGHNVFHFERCEERRGRYWQRDWKVIGWQEVRAFLEVIGPKNISFMRRISWVLADSSHSPRMTPAGQKKYERFAKYEAALHHCLRLVGFHATHLEKFAFYFNCKTAVDVTDVALMDAILRIKADKVIDVYHPRVHHSASNLTVEAKTKLVTTMTKVHEVPPATPRYSVKMYCERAHQSYFSQP